MPVPIRAICPAIAALILMGAVAQANEPIDLSPQIEPDSASQVSIELEAGGNMLVRAETPQNGTLAPEQRPPMSVSAKLQYTERRLANPTTATRSGSPLAVRFYDVAEAVIKVDQSGIAPRLAEDRRLIVLENAGFRPTLYCPKGALPREQLDLIDAIGNSYVVDELLPQTPVADGQSWPSKPTAIAALLTLDSVAVCEVQSVLEEFNGSFAKVRLAGVVHGTVDGAATEQEVRGVYLFDRTLRRITRLNLAVREKRSIGGATPGLDAVAKLQIKIEPCKLPPQLADPAIASIGITPRVAARDLIYEAAPLGFRIQHDRQWFITSKQRESVTLRRVEGSDLVAQCTLTALPPKSAGRQTTLEQFQQDVTYSLGKSFGELVSTRHWQSSHGHYCYEVVVRGMVEELPVEWHYFLVSRQSGHRVSVAVTIQGPMVERVQGADRALVESLELFVPLPAAQTSAVDDAAITK